MGYRKRISIVPDKRSGKASTWWAGLTRKARADTFAIDIHWDGELLEDLFFPALFLIMLLPVPLWPFVKHGDWNQDFWYSIKLTAFPIFLTVLIGSWVITPRFWATSTWLGVGATVLLATGMLTVLSPVPVAAINRWYGESEPVIVSGTVLDKLDNREGAYGVRLKTRDGVLKLRVPRREYDQIVVGGEFSRRYMRGSLGLLYRDD
ncbi:MAG TPA: hypothetical protein VFS20_34045 [Longimicrobium sp.]|nr:hypothetical protein [Longimicrobium sp.]